MGPSHLNSTGQNHWRPLQLMIFALFVLCAGAVGNGQEIFLGVTYVCNGERLVIDGCNITTPPTPGNATSRILITSARRESRRIRT
jgi:hypothetical protein